jgi:hemoglobin-like flavoprotein
MTSTAIPEDVRLHLTESIAVVAAHRERITSLMQAHLAALASEAEASGHGEVAGAMLVEMLLESASHVAACGAIGDLSGRSGVHQRHSIDGRHYSRFGLALAPIMREVLGPSLPPRIVSAWCDAYWITVQHMTPREEPRPKLRLNGFARS